MGLSYSDVLRKCELYQMETDYVSGKYIFLRERDQLWAALQEYCTFNTYMTFSAMNWYKEFQMFLFYHGDELKRKLEFSEFVLYGMRFRVLSSVCEPKDFADFKLKWGKVKKAKQLSN